MQSRIVAVRSAVVDGLAAVFASESVEVSFQWVAKSSKRERIWTQRARFVHGPAAMTGATRLPRNEEGRFDVMVLVEGVGKTAEWTSERALELGLDVEEFIADRRNNQLGITGLQTLTVEGEGTLVEMFNDSGHLAELTIPIRFTARLT